MSKPSQPMLDKFLLNGSFQCNKKKLEKKKEGTSSGIEKEEIA